jgi:non-ribosomal peptide synthetase component F
VRTVHRRVEQQAALKSDHPALVSGSDTMSYQHLNARANRLARRLIAHGFRRGDRAVIALPPSANLLVAELAVLKAGGAYACPVSRLAYTVATPFSVLRDGVAHGIDIALAGAAAAACPNLPVLVRDEDTACVLADREGALTITIPHAAIVESREHPTLEWLPDAPPYRHWAALMAGETLRLAAASASLPPCTLDSAA